MPARFCGVFQTTPFTTAQRPSLPAGHDTLSLANAVLSYQTSSDVSLAEHRDRHCLALGQPHFKDTQLEQLRQQQGSAAAWLMACDKYGDQAAAHVSGRHAVILVSEAGQKLTLISDRFATWPICFAEQDGRLYIADRADALAALGHRSSLSTQALHHYLHFHMIPAPTTVFAGIQRLPQGQVLGWQGGKCSTRPWWRPQFDEHHTPDLASAKQQFLDLVEQGVRQVLEDRNPQEVGCFLSGGTDSSTITGMLCKLQGGPARSYSMGFDAAGYDEMEYARIAARHFGADHREYYVTPDDLVAAIPRVAVHYDQPFGNSSAVPAWICVSRARQDGVTHMLAGDGGDELFGGNARYAKQRLFGVYEQLPAALRSGLLEPVFGNALVSRLPLLKKGSSYIEQARVPLPDRLDMYNMLTQLGLASVYTREFLAQVDIDQPAREQRACWQDCQARAQINRLLHYDWKFTVADNDLVKVIGTTELAGMGVSFPLLSDELTDFSLQLPPEWKLKGLQLRWFFKEALRGFLPEAILTKKKHGFGLPFGVWVNQHSGLRRLTEEALASFKTRGIVRPDFIDSLLHTHLPSHPGYYGEMVWILLILELWLREHQADYRLS